MVTVAELPDEALTEERAALLESAFRRGYFDEPRRISLSELAELHGMTDVTASVELRAGMRSLVEAGLLEG